MQSAPTLYSNDWFSSPMASPAGGMGGPSADSLQMPAFGSSIGGGGMGDAATAGAGGAAMGMGPWGAVAGLLKSELIDRPAAERGAQLAAKTARYSPWLNGSVVAEGLGRDKGFNPIAGPMQGFAQGSAMQQSLDEASQKKANQQVWRDVMKEYLKDKSNA